MSEPQNETRSPHGGRVFRYLPTSGGQHVTHIGRTFGLGRHVNHDPASRRYAAALAGPPDHQVFWPRQVPIFDQGRLGSCTPNAGLGILGTARHYSAPEPMGTVPDDGARIRLLESAAGDRYWPSGRIPFDENGAVGLYHEITENDPFDGAYPPDD